MGQVPAVDSKSAAPAILVVGDGRLAHTLLQVLADGSQKQFHRIRFKQWSRRSSVAPDASPAVPLADIISEFDPTHVWLAISDSALGTFAREHSSLLKDRIVVHFAGSLSSFDSVHAAHPLTTFATGHSGATEFSKVPFILDTDGPELSVLMPGFGNPSYRLDPKKRAYYHALCAISGNFTVLLWETVAARFETTLGLPRIALDAYRNQIFRNLNLANGESVLTGPIARGDFDTISKHRDSLFERYEMPLLKIYDAFLDLYRTQKSKQKEQA